ncbi:MAG: DUF4982 domain-containing protein [Solobacterium sp.]|nr:DUF4982 domain-containing protein [Solobacterium sp.]
MDKMIAKRILKLLYILCLFIVCLPVHVHAQTSGTVNQISEAGRGILFNDGWKFCGEDGAFAEASFDDSGWRSVTLPHDWSIENEFTAEAEAESGFLKGGTGWYRKTFAVSEDLSGKRFTIDFDGVYMNSTVYVNGVKLGTHPYGYTPFSFDITDELITDGTAENVIAVKVENEQPNSRWYSGSGIYRDVRLNVTDPVHVFRYGVQITSENLHQEYQGDTDTKVCVTVQNETDSVQRVTVRNTVTGPDGSEAASGSQDIEIEAGQKAVTEDHLSVFRPLLWTVDEPNLYRMKTEIICGGETADTYESTYGYRWISMDPETGFSLNGQPVKLKGVCLHHDQGALGAAAYDDAILRQIRIMKDMGVNAVRTAHNPASESLIRICSEQGIMVIEEAFDTFINPKNGNVNDYSGIFSQWIREDNQIIRPADYEMTWAEFDVRSMAERDRNAPCVIMWSVGNELLGNIEGDISGYRDCTFMLLDWIRRSDWSKLVTLADNLTSTQNGISQDAVKKSMQNQMDEAIMIAEGAIGLNYADGSAYDQFHAEHPDWPIYGSETSSALSSRSWYSTYGIDSRNHQVSSRISDKAAAEWGETAAQAWLDVITRDFTAGGFIWTGFDYIGEPEPWNGVEPGSVTGGQPSPKSSYFGAVDTAGFEKDTYYFYRSQWNDDSVTLHILPSWDKKEVKRFLGFTKVVVYSNAPQVELFLNGKSLGVKKYESFETEHGYTYQLYKKQPYYSWTVFFRSGVLSAKAYDEEGREITETTGRNVTATPSEAASLLLSAESQASGKGGLVYISADITDAEGNPVITDDRKIHFVLEGEGRILGTDNGNAADISSYRGISDTEAYRSTFRGKALVIIQAEGAFRLLAEAEGLPSAQIAGEVPE